MKLHLYSIHDRLMGVYLAPFVARADVEAVRQITATLEDPSMAKSAIVLKPSDYDLVKIGSFDDETGFIDSGSLPEVIGPVSGLRTVSP